MKILNGKILSTIIKEEIKKEVEEYVRDDNRAPHLVTVLVGDNTASATYVNSKMKSCQEVNMKATLLHLPKDTSEDELLNTVRKLNADRDVDGFIVQLPLPKHIDADKVNLAIEPRKDVDGFHPENLGRMMLGLPAYISATPYGILKILEYYEIETSGKNCVVLGRSAIVGRPVSILLSSKRNPGNCTVTVVHSGTKDAELYLREADIVIAAIGKANYLKRSMLKEGVVVIDVGINRIEDATKKKGYRLVGDADYEDLKDYCSAITPVPGGVGLMTVVSLLLNTLKAARKEVYPD